MDFPSAWSYLDILFLGGVLVAFLGFGGTLFYVSNSQRTDSQ
jgi:hypothetical protein